MARLRMMMHARGIEALLCLKPQSSFYLSGFNPIHYTHPVVALLPFDGDPVLLVHALRDAHARATGWIKDVRLFGAWAEKETMGLDWLAALCSILAERQLLSATLGVDGDFVPIRTMSQLQNRLPNARFSDATDLITASRMLKDPMEVRYARMAAEISEVGMEIAIRAVAERKSERAISIEAMAAMNRAWLERFPDIEVADFGNLEGGVQNGLWCNCLTGDHVTWSADNPTLRIPVEGEIAMSVIWANCNGIHVENERAIAVGKLDGRRQRAYEAMLEINRVARASVRPGVTCADVFNATSAVYRRLGYGAQLPGRIGHGMGLGGHEPPYLDSTSETVLQPGMIVTVEPNLRTVDFSLQHSDTVVVTETGSECLTRTRRDFIQA